MIMFKKDTDLRNKAIWSLWDLETIPVRLSQWRIPLILERNRIWDRRRFENTFKNSALHFVIRAGTLCCSFSNSGTSDWYEISRRFVRFQQILGIVFVCFNILKSCDNTRNVLFYLSIHRIPQVTCQTSRFLMTPGRYSLACTCYRLFAPHPP